MTFFTSILEWFGAIVLVLGSLLLFASAVGALRFPDFWSRSAAISIAATLGLVCIALPIIIHAETGSERMKIVGITIFVLVSAPVASHLLGRAAFRRRLPSMPGTRNYDDTKH